MRKASRIVKNILRNIVTGFPEIREYILHLRNDVDFKWERYTFEYGSTLPDMAGVVVAWYYLSQLVKLFWCCIVGHDLTDVGYVGPDSGEIDLECGRCFAYHYHVILY